jgi:hypothetical protein
MNQRTIDQWLLVAADPITAAAPPPGDATLDGLMTLFAAAQEHAVLGSVLASAVRWQLGKRLTKPQDRQQYDSLVEHLQIDHLRDTGRTLGLQQLARQAVQAFDAAGIPSCVIKGEDFAARLYPNRALRPYRDVDLLVPRDAFADADAILQALEFTPLAPDRKYEAAEYGQISYLANCSEKWSFELHWNLINSPSQRQTCSLAWDDLKMTPPEHLGEPWLLTPTSLLVLAVVHACIGHRFDSLQQMCDIRQICRGAAGPVDAARLMDDCRRGHCETPLRWSLELLIRLFNCPAARALAAQCRFSGHSVRTFGILGRHTVLRPNSATSRLRRSWARRRLKHAA